MAVSQSRWDLGILGCIRGSHRHWCEKKILKADLIVSFGCSNGRVCLVKRTNWSCDKLFRAEIRTGSLCTAIIFQCLYCWIGHFLNVVELVKCSWICTSNLFIIFLPYSVLLNFDMNSCQKELSLFPLPLWGLCFESGRAHHNAFFINQEKTSSTL